MAGTVLKEGRSRSALLWVMAILAVAHLPLFLGQIIFFRDQAHWNYPARWFFRDSLLRGDLPFWNPGQGLGFSVLANPLYGLFYPPNWLFLLVPRGLVASMVSWQTFAHVVWGSVGAALLARQLRVLPAATIVTGVAWGLSGFVTSGWSAGLLALSSAWVPWCAVGFIRLVRHARQPAGGRSSGAAGWLASVVPAALPVAMAILLGEVFFAMIGVAFGAALAAIALRADRILDPQLPSLRQARWRPVAGVALAVVLAAGVGAVVVIPARTIAATTARANPLARAVAEGGSLHPLRIIELAAPGSMGQPLGDHPASPWVGETILDGSVLMGTVYLGAGALALAFLALARGRALPALLAVVAVAVLAISLGRHTPVHHWLRTLVPPLSYMRYPEKYLVALVTTVALLAGLGAARVLGRDPPSHLWRRTAVWVALLAMLAAVAGTAFPEDWARHVRAGALQAGGAVVLILIAQILARRRPRAAAALLVAAVATDLAIAAWPYLGFGPRSVAVDVPPAANAVLADHRRRAGPSAPPPRLYRAAAVERSTQRYVPTDTHPGGERRSMQTLIHNTLNSFGIATIHGYDAAIPAAVGELWGAGQSKGLGQHVLRLTGTEYAILPIDDPGERVERRQGLEPMLDPLPGARLYRVPGALPRVYLAGRAELVFDDEAKRRLLDQEVVAGGLALLASDPGGAVTVGLDAPASRAGECRLTSFSNVRVIATCRVDRPAIAVFNEQHDAGWTAQVDGLAAPLLRANLLMRAVWLDRGAHTVILSYTPPGLRGGLVVSSAALCVLAGLALAPLARHRRSRAVRS